MSNYEDENIVETTTYTTYGTPSKRTVVETTTYRSPSSPRSPSKTTVVTRKNPSINPHNNNSHAHTPLVSSINEEYERRIETTYVHHHGDTTTEEVYVSSPTRGDISPRGRKTPHHHTTTYVEPVVNRLPELSTLYSPAKSITEVHTVSPSRSTRSVQYVTSPTREVVTHFTHVGPETSVGVIDAEMDRTRARMEEMTDIFQLHAAIKPGEPLYHFPYNTSPTRSGPAHETVVVKQVSPTKTITTTHISPVKSYSHSISPVTQYVTTTESPIRYVTSVSPVKTTTVSSPGWAYRSGSHDLLE